MANNLRRPPNAQVTASEESLKQSPADKPMWKAGMGQEQVTSSRMPLSHKSCPVANLENKPGRHGVEQATSSKCDLRRKASGPYDPVSRTTPEVDL